MGIRVTCPDCGHKMNLKSFLAGKRGVCPNCDAKFVIPAEDGEGKRPDASASGRAEQKPAAAQPSSAPSPAPVAVQDAPQPSAPAPAPASPQPAPAPAPQSAPAPAPQTAPAPVPQGTPAPVPQSAPAPVPQSAPAPVQPAPAPVQPVQAAPDPLAEAPNAVWYVRPPSGGQFGPAKADMMRQWVAEGRVTPESLIWREGWADWQRADAVLPQFKPSPSPAAPVTPAGGGFVDTAPARTGGRPVTYRRQNTAGRMVAIVALCLILLVLLPLLIFVLLNPGWFSSG